jgi:hypothetical protein
VSQLSRRQKSEAKLRSLEEQFSNNLIAALCDCAAGKWGMFGQNDLVDGPKSKVAQELLEAGEEIERLRQELGYTEPFQPFRRYLEYRQMKGSNTAGEPKLAYSFLKELGASAESNGQ